jgi:hypothetical protein
VLGKYKFWIEANRRKTSDSNQTESKPLTASLLTISLARYCRNDRCAAKSGTLNLLATSIRKGAYVKMRIDTFPIILNLSWSNSDFPFDAVIVSVSLRPAGIARG